MGGCGRVSTLAGVGTAAPAHNPPRAVSAGDPCGRVMAVEVPSSLRTVRCHLSSPSSQYHSFFLTPRVVSPSSQKDVTKSSELEVCCAHDHRESTTGKHGCSACFQLASQHVQNQQTFLFAKNGDRHGRLDLCSSEALHRHGCVILQVYFSSINASTATNDEAVVSTANQEDDFRAQVHETFRALQVREGSGRGIVPSHPIPHARNDQQRDTLHHAVASWRWSSSS